MKRFVCLFGALAVLTLGRAQTSLCISTDKTTSLVFPFPIKHVDRGTQAVLAQQVKDAPAVLLVKAGNRNFPETNLTVVTEDGSLYSFQVRYDGNPAQLTFRLPVQTKESIAATARALLDNAAFINRLRTRRLDVQLQVIGVYIKESIIYVQLELKNLGPIGYDVDMLRFFTADRKRNKRTAVQETDLKQLHLAGNGAVVSPMSTNALVVALEKFTIPDHQYMGIQVAERNGGRHLTIHANNRLLMQAKPVNN